MRRPSARVRDAEFRYTAWVPWIGSTLQGNWSATPIAADGVFVDGQTYYHDLCKDRQAVHPEPASSSATVPVGTVKNPFLTGFSLMSYVVLERGIPGRGSLDGSCEVIMRKCRRYVDPCPGGELHIRRCFVLAGWGRSRLNNRRTPPEMSLDPPGTDRYTVCTSSP